MGFFSKIFKGVKKVFKKIGRAIKKVAMKVGKFMDKIGIVGQIAMSLLLPGLGEVLGALASTMMGSASTIVSGMGNFLNGAINIATKAGGIVKDIGKGIFKVVGKTIGATINAIPGGSKLTGFISDVTAGKLDMTGDTFLGKGGVFDTAKSEAINIKTGVGDLFSKKTLTDTNVYSDKYEKAKYEKEFPIEANAPKPEDLLSDTVGEDGRSMTGLDPKEMEIENLKKSIDKPVYDNQELNRSYVNDPMVSYVDAPTEFEKGLNPNQPLSADDTVQEVGEYGNAGAATPENIIKTDPSLLAQQDSIGTRIYKSDIVQKSIDRTRDKLSNLTLSGVAKGVYKTYKEGQLGYEGEETMESYSRGFTVPTVDQYAVQTGVNVENFAGNMQIPTYSANYTAYNSDWAKAFSNAYNQNA
tara:strand:+ start:395 stop:1633 length:1239 start_codon:yes stop_codon:yes gene_type:complete